jgi:hypothetical protein
VDDQGLTEDSSSWGWWSCKSEPRPSPVKSPTNQKTGEEEEEERNKKNVMKTERNPKEEEKKIKSPEGEQHKRRFLSLLYQQRNHRTHIHTHESTKTIRVGDG